MSTQYHRGPAWTNVCPGMLNGAPVVSVWNWEKGEYDYYRPPASAIPGYGDEVEHPPSRQLAGVLGEDPDRSGHSLPSGSRYTGSGQQAIGSIVALPQTPMGIATWGALALAIGAPIMMLLGAIHISDWFRGERWTEAR